MAAVAVDVGYLAASYSVPASTLESLLSTPTVELVQSLLVQIEAKARAYDDLKSDKLRSDLELENTVRGNVARQKALKATADKALKELEELRTKCSQQEAAREQLETELQSVKSAASNSTTEVQALETRIKSLEAQNRDAIALHESKSAAHDRLAEDLAGQHQKLVNIRKQLAELEEKNQSLENAATSAKYREQNLQREIESLKKSNDWYESELEKRTADNTKFRKEKNAKIAELQRMNADAAQEIETLRRTETTQRQRLEEMEQKVEQSLVRIQQLQDEAAQKQQSYQAELDNTRRLATLHQESANTAKAHLQQVKDQLDAVNDNAAHEVGQLQAEVDSERNQREATEAKVAELELHIESLQLQITELKSAPQVPATPRRGGLNAAFETPGRAGSPGVFSPGSARSRGGLSTTQLYAENTQLKKDLRVLQEKEANLNNVMQEMMAELEQRQPEIDELRQENERLTEETGSISELLHEATRERELARKEARKYQGDYQGLLRENEIQRQQLRDLSAQITMLLLQQRAHEGGLDALSDEEKSFLREYTASGTMPKELVSDSTDTGRIISERLVLFKDIHELQKQNQELLRTIREVADRYEGSEALQKTNEIERDRKELARLREQVAQHQDEIKSLELRSQSLTKERDMFRRIVTSRGQIPAGADMEAMFGQSLNGAAPSTPSRNMSQGVEQTPRSKEIAGYEKLVKDLQAHLDALRRESATDMATLRQQRDQLAKDNSQLQGDKMRLENAVQLGNERFELQGNKLSLLQSENNELKKRCDTLQDLAAKQDIKTQQVAEDLLEAKSQAESLERENANLKASRDLAKSTEQRLQSENASLMEERSRLSKMISDLQNLRNEQELTESENRRRLQSRAESLEAELQALKRKLDDEIEEHKRATLLLENEQLKSRNTIDDLRKLINNIRPELASVKTERDHLQARVEELKAELRIAEERGQNLQPRPTPRTTTMDASSEEDITREEQLSIEIANLKHDLEVAQEEKESAKTDAAKYRAIASDSEEQLESWLESQEQFRQEMDGMLAEKENNIRDLEKRVEEISAELAATNTELSELRRTHDEEGALFNQRKAELDSEITRLKEEADRYKQTAAFHQEDLKAQADIATRAQQNYENELVKHSEAMKNLQKEREEHNKLKSEVAQFKAQAEGAREALEEGKEHWSETRERYERELAQSRTKLDELEEQNKIVHQQLENVSTQIASLKQSRVSVAGGDSDALNSDQTSGLQEVVNYLRKEKEILEVQYEIALNENKKLEATVKGLQSQLDQTREMLSAAQQSQAQTQQAGLSLEAYQRNVEQMNTIRESNITLRNELRQATSRLEEKSKEVEDLYAQIQPLQARVQELEIELEATVKELESARQNGDHWQKRCQDVLHKYDRIDPAELEALKDKITSLESERDEASAKNASIEDEKKAIQTELDQANEKIRGFDERRQKMVTQFKDKARELSGKIKEREDRIKEAQDELNMAREQLGQVQKELEVTRAERDEAIANASSSANATNDTTMGEEGQVREDLPSEERQALEERVKAAEDRFNEEANRSVALHIQTQEKDGRVRELENTVGELQQRITGLNQELTDAQNQRDQGAARIRELEAQLTAAGGSAADDLQQRLNEATGRIQELEAQLSTVAAPVEGGSDAVATLQSELQKLQEEINRQTKEIEKYKQELVAKEKEVEDLRARSEMQSSVSGGGEGTSASVEEQVEQKVSVIKEQLEAKNKEAEQDYQKRAQDAEEKATRRTEGMKDKYNKALRKNREDHDEAIAKLNAEHEAAISKLKAEHAVEIAQVRQSTQITTEPSAATAPGDTEAPTKFTDGSIPDLSKQQIQTILAQSEHAMGIIRSNVKTQLQLNEAKLNEKHAKEIEELNQQHAKKVEELEAKIAASNPEKIKEESAKMHQAKLSLHQNRANKFKLQLDVVEKAAKETPERHVAEVWEEAKVAKQPPSKPITESSTAASTAVTAQSPQSGTQGQPQPSPRPTFGTANGATANPFMQPSHGQPTFGQPQMGQASFAQPGTFGRPSGQPLQNLGQQPQAFGQGLQQGRPAMHNQGQPGFGAFTGMAQPGFTGAQNLTQPATASTSRPNSPFTNQAQQQQPQQGGRGRGQDHVGTGPAALRNLASQQGQAPQSSIPRGGGIPRPSGRGQGSQSQQTQTNAPGAGGSQIGRGGGRGGRGGRGGGQIQTNLPGGQGQGQNSPRGLNPTAQGFQPGGGRGQKRTRGDDHGDGEGHQGSKRARGGGGGAGGQAQS